jgi:4-carboxymuconolactone decarboxylase
MQAGIGLGCLAASLVLQKEEEARRLITDLRLALDREMLREAILQTYLFDGYPTALEGMGLLADVWPEDPRPIETGEFSDWERWRNRGNDLYRRIYGEGVAERLQQRAFQLSPELARWMIVEGYGKVLGRGVLELADRELIIIALLTVKRRPRQLHSHLRGAIRLGVPRETIRELWAELRRMLSPAGLEEAESILSGL